MSEAVIVAVLGFLGTLTGAYFANKRSGALIAYRLEALEKKVDRHNTVIERTYELERKADVAAEQIRSVNHRISDLEHNKS